MPWWRLGSSEVVVSLVELPPADRHRAVSAAFRRTCWRGDELGGVDTGRRMDGRDVVSHLIDWFTAFLAAGGIELPAGPAVADDPPAAWRAHSAGVQALFDGADAESMFTHPMAGSHRLAEAIDRFYTADVYMHTWDLATAAGRQADLDPRFAECWSTVCRRWKNCCVRPDSTAPPSLLAPTPTR